MHELSITRNIVAIVADKAAGRTVRSVRLTVGKLAGVELQAVRFCFDMCAEEAGIGGAELIVDEVEGRGRCQECGEAVALDSLIGICPCPKRAKLVIEAGEELLVKEMEVV